MPIMTGAQLLARARKYTDDMIAPYYTTDEDMYLYLSEAEGDLAAAGMMLRDVKTYHLAAGVRWLYLREDPEILELRTAVLIDPSDNRWEMRLTGGMDQVPADRSYGDDYGLVAASNRLTPGRPQTLTFGKRANFVEVVPPPDGTYSVECTVITYPGCPLEKAGDTPSIPERHHAAIAIGGALLSLDATKHEFAAPKIANLETAWQRALIRAADEAGNIHRDASVVQFTNDMWA